MIRSFCQKGKSKLIKKSKPRQRNEKQKCEKKKKEKVWKSDKGSSAQAAEQIVIVKVHSKERKHESTHHKPMRATGK